MITILLLRKAGWTRDQGTKRFFHLQKSRELIKENSIEYRTNRRCKTQNGNVLGTKAPDVHLLVRLLVQSQATDAVTRLVGTFEEACNAPSIQAKWVKDRKWYKIGNDRQRC